MSKTLQAGAPKVRIGTFIPTKMHEKSPITYTVYIEIFIYFDIISTILNSH